MADTDIEQDTKLSLYMGSNVGIAETLGPQKFKETKYLIK
jgi:hypothetical protein